jgi:hypothetical protein
MANKMPVFGAAAGAQGAAFPKVLQFLAKAVGNYVINDTNFAGIGMYLPGFVQIASGTAGNVKVQMSTDNGTTWKDCAAASGGLFFVDTGGVTGLGQGVSTAANVRIVVSTGATDIFLFPVAQ